jgi:DNA invertase Pin-like site-specific DNA recombinase
MPNSSISRRLGSLPTLSKAALCELWSQIFNASPSPKLRRDLMVPILAYRLQEQLFGSLRAPARGRLRHLSQALERNSDTGGSMERPALKRLLEDVQANKVNIITVYKVDRLTRSLADFAKIVEALDARNVSFVSVTQQFNTTSSMGRLTLNVLFSFAQFEREVTGERIRDKIAASKRKGMWMGGLVPLGYDLEGRKLIPSLKESELVCKIFSLYLKMGCVSKLAVQLDREKIRSKVWTTRTGARLEVSPSRMARYTPCCGIGFTLGRFAIATSGIRANTKV